jgi:hypothetical protein
MNFGQRLASVIVFSFLCPYKRGRREKRISFSEQDLDIIVVA